MGGLSALLEQMAVIMIGGCIGSAWLVSFVIINLIGIGECPYISMLIGSAAGVGSIFILPTDALWVSMVIAGVVTLIAGIAIDKLFYVSGKSLTKSSGNSPTVSAPPQQQFAVQPSEPKPQAVQPVKAETDKKQSEADWVCEKCDKQNTADAKFCRYCGASKPQVKAEEKTEEIICPNCGEVIAAGRKFCRNCGEKAPEQEVRQKAEPQELPKEQPVQAVPPIQQQPQVQQPQQMQQMQAQQAQAYAQAQAYYQGYAQTYPQYYAQPYVQTAPNGDWMCPYCQNINERDIYYCRRCGYPRSVQPYYAKKEKKNPGLVAKIFFYIVAAVGVLSNLLLLNSVINARNSLIARMDSYYDLNKIEADFIGFELIAAGAAVLGYILMMILRKKQFGLIGSCGAALACILFVTTCEQVKILKVDLTLTIVCLVASFLLCGVYCFLDKIWVGAVNVLLSGLALYLLLSGVKKANIYYTSNVIMWANLVGNTLVMLLLGIANKLSAKPKSDEQNKVENTQAVN